MTNTRTILFGSFVSIFALIGALMITQTAFANVDDNEGGDRHKRVHSGIHISNSNSAFVLNDVETKANTGKNTAEGSYAGDGGNGGDIENNSGEQDVEGSGTGSGGAGGNSGLGGAVQTGDALAETSLDNNINSNNIGIDKCACEERASSSDSNIRVRIHNNNHAFLGNRVGTKANSGDNLANGSEAGDGGNGGDIENGENHHGHGPVKLDNENDNEEDGDQEVDDSTTGSGGAGGSSSAGGSVLTGQATSRATMVNVINSNIVRVRG